MSEKTMSDTLTALTSAKDVLDTLMFQSWIRPDWAQRITEAAMELESDIASLTAPFDPAKHLSGWVKQPVLNNTNLWKCGEFTLEQDPDAWGIYQYGSPVYYGPIKTRAFFALLCGALGITTTTRGVAKTK